MMVEITYQMVLSTLQTLSLIIGITYYLLILQNQQKNQQIALETRQAQLFQSIYNRYQDKEFVEMEVEIQSYDMSDIDTIYEKYGDEAWTKMMIIGRYYEGLGVYVSKGLIDASLVNDLMSEPVMINWEKAEPLVYEYRERMNVPTFGEFFEYLYNQVKPLYEKQHPRQPAP